jgi:hypothetical protein
VKIQVTQEDIDIGVKGSSTQCPIARAITRLGYADVIVGASIDFYTNSYHEDYHNYPTPVIALDFIDAFDYSEPVEPFEFELI